MKNLILKPSKEWHSNDNLSGQNYEDVIDLPITRVGNFAPDAHMKGENWRGIVSVWRVSLWKRFLFLFDGRINFCILGENHAPVAISIGDYFDKSEEKND